jgi:hypothetical protein
MDSGNADNYLLLGTYTDRQHTWTVGVVMVNGRAAACSVSINKV